MQDNLIELNMPYLCKSYKNGHNVEAKQLFKLFWVTLLALISLTGTVVAVIIVGVSFENRIEKMHSAQEHRIDPLNQTIQQKLNYLLSQSPTE